jgi:hypothetical protein
MASLIMASVRASGHRSAGSELEGAAIDRVLSDFAVSKRLTILDIKPVKITSRDKKRNTKPIPYNMRVMPSWISAGSVMDEHLKYVRTQWNDPISGFIVTPMKALYSIDNRKHALLANLSKQIMQGPR